VPTASAVRILDQPRPDRIGKIAAR
jgi:hypothetical protein